jgi:hypothetical protein
MPRMMMTTKSSISVKPCSEPRRVFRRAIICLLLEGMARSSSARTLLRLNPFGAFASLIKGDLFTEKRNAPPPEPFQQRVKQ